MSEARTETSGGLWPTLLSVWRHRFFLTPFKLANLGLANLPWLLRTDPVIGMPYAVTIEPTNFCNANCRLCPVGQGHTTWEKGVLSWERYREWIDRYSRWIYCLGLSLWGDPLTVHHIYRMIAYAHRARIWTCLSTNLHAFRQERGDADALVESGLDDLTCSLHAASQRTYEIYQPGRDFPATLAKVRALTEARRRLSGTTPAIHLNFVVTRFNEREIPAFLQLARDLGCEPKLTSPSLNLRFLPPEDRDREVENRLRNWLPGNPAFVKKPYQRLLEGKNVEDGNARHQCRELWRHATITWDGMVVPCSGPRRREEAFGDLSVQSLGRIWNGPRYRMARRSLTRPAADDVVCAHC